MEKMNIKVQLSSITTGEARGESKKSTEQLEVVSGAIFQVAGNLETKKNLF